MSAACSGADDLDPRLFDVFRCVSDVLGHVKGAVAGMSGGRGHDARAGGPWDWGFGWPGGQKQWQGGFGGQWGRWWPYSRQTEGRSGPPGGPGSPRGQKAGRGDVRAAILALLREGPRNGYQIMSEIEERSGGAWRPSPGAVYPALAQLADEGLIVGEESGGRRTFSLTDAGRAYVEENPEMARGTWESMAQQELGEMPGLIAQAARLGASIVQIAHAGTPEQIHAAERLLEQTRRRLYQILAEDEDTGTEQDRIGERTAMDDRIRISDADRDRVTARLRDHFAEGRLTPDELDERVTAALNAKTFGDLRRVMADLPGPAPQPPRAQPLAAARRAALDVPPPAAADSAARAARACRGAADASRRVAVLRVSQGDPGAVAGDLPGRDLPGRPVPPADPPRLVVRLRPRPVPGLAARLPAAGAGTSSPWAVARSRPRDGYGEATAEG